MNKIKFLIALLLVISCNSNQWGNRKEKKDTPDSVMVNPFILDHATLGKLENEILSAGDTAAYLKAKNHYFNSSQYDKFLYYSLTMANKYKYNLAFYDVFIELTHPMTGESFAKIDKRTQYLALHYLVKSYELSYYDAVYDIKDLVGEKKPFPTSGYYLNQLSLLK
jgi:hypothetical protein